MGQCEKCKQACWSTQQVLCSPRDLFVHRECWSDLKAANLLNRFPEIHRIYLEHHVVTVGKVLNGMMFRYRSQPLTDDQRKNLQDRTDNLFALIDDLIEIIP